MSLPVPVTPGFACSDLQLVRKITLLSAQNNLVSIHFEWAQEKISAEISAGFATVGEGTQEV